MTDSISKDIKDKINFHNFQHYQVMDEKYGESFFVPPVQYQIGLGTHTIGTCTKNVKYAYHIQNNIMQINVYHSFLWIVTFGSFFN